MSTEKNFFRDEPAYGDMPVEAFRRAGHQVIDWIADYLKEVGRLPVLPAVQPGAVRRALPATPPPHGEDMTAVLADLDRLIMPGMTHWNHPRFFAYFTSSASGPGILGDLLAAAFNSNSMLWQASPAATELEEVTLDWLRQMLGLPADFWGLIFDTASTSTLHGLAAAREQLGDLQIHERGMAGRADLPRLRLYVSDYTHSSIDKAALLIGLGREGIRRIPVDAEFRMQPAALAQAIQDDRRAGWRPFCVVATVGTTSCTSIDPVAEIAQICATENLWLHVDAAHGGAVAIVPEMRHVLAGCELADSFVVNPHKWLFVPMDLSVLYTRKPEVLRRAFSLVPEYLRTPADSGVINYMDYGIPLGRRFRALKLWFVLRSFGVTGLQACIREHLRLAREFAGWVDRHPDFERLAPVPMSTICFRAHPASLNEESRLNELNERLLHAVNRTGEAFLSHTKIDGRFVLRLVISHLRVTPADVERVWAVLQQQLGALN
ncbi:MAG: pyridoxal-dependent decarboxylase [candidate division KSB1 bacterium]|nr:pyridoxal-dependent decarboxylase [candidate division KSB1 bacterium]MDZ7274102.1 pyridoxal-dependent decarboxylase [candidate division KSB1 bacterium]MDZ7287854.1 pyridoxal-dependent decarboxylase [candidate division KSB1 bacterium]MDZ7296700.1 pyridoxal-dependent decarboxylase [candidate division KSB1 bacterium]MDZ7306930.1 pyridoxal-dependent decarboxylase [candidate division KSB1 bacterium]